MVLVDTNVLLDLLTKDPSWATWSEHQLEAASTAGRIVVNKVVYAELCVRADRMEDVDAFLQNVGISVLPIPRAGLFLAGKVFAQYRANGGSRTGVLPDFFIGAHAAAEKLTVLTRDQGRFITHFPTVTLIAP